MNIKIKDNKGSKLYLTQHLILVCLLSSGVLLGFAQVDDDSFDPADFWKPRPERPFPEQNVFVDELDDIVTYRIYDKGYPDNYDELIEDILWRIQHEPKSRELQLKWEGGEIFPVDRAMSNANTGSGFVDFRSTNILGSDINISLPRQRLGAEGLLQVNAENYISYYRTFNLPSRLASTETALAGAFVTQVGDTYIGTVDRLVRRIHGFTDEDRLMYGVNMLAFQEETAILSSNPRGPLDPFDLRAFEIVGQDPRSGQNGIRIIVSHFDVVRPEMATELNSRGFFVPSSIQRNEGITDETLGYFRTLYNMEEEILVDPINQATIDARKRLVGLGDGLTLKPFDPRDVFRKLTAGAPLPVDLNELEFATADAISDAYHDLIKNAKVNAKSQIAIEQLYRNRKQGYAPGWDLKGATTLPEAMQPALRLPKNVTMTRRLASAKVATRLAKKGAIAVGGLVLNNVVGPLDDVAVITDAFEIKDNDGNLRGQATMDGRVLTIEIFGHYSNTPVVSFGDGNQVEMEAVYNSSAFESTKNLAKYGTSRVITPIALFTESEDPRSFYVSGYKITHEYNGDGGIYDVFVFTSAVGVSSAIKHLLFGPGVLEPTNIQGSRAIDVYSPSPFTADKKLTVVVPPKEFTLDYRRRDNEDGSCDITIIPTMKGIQYHNRFAYDMFIYNANVIDKSTLENTPDLVDDYSTIFDNKHLKKVFTWESSYQLPPSNTFTAPKEWQNLGVFVRLHTANTDGPFKVDRALLIDIHQPGTLSEYLPFVHIEDQGNGIASIATQNTRPNAGVINRWNIYEAIPNAGVSNIWSIYGPVPGPRDPDQQPIASFTTTPQSKGDKDLLQIHVINKYLDKKYKEKNPGLKPGAYLADLDVYDDGETDQTIPFFIGCPSEPKEVDFTATQATIEEAPGKPYAIKLTFGNSIKADPYMTDFHSQQRFVIQVDGKRLDYSIDHPLPVDDIIIPLETSGTYVVLISQVNPCWHVNSSQKIVIYPNTNEVAVDKVKLSTSVTQNDNLIDVEIRGPAYTDNGYYLTHVGSVNRNVKILDDDGNDINSSDDPDCEACSDEDKVRFIEALAKQRTYNTYFQKSPIKLHREGLDLSEYIHVIGKDGADARVAFQAEDWIKKGAEYGNEVTIVPLIKGGDPVRIPFGEDPMDMSKDGLSYFDCPFAFAYNDLGTKEAVIATNEYSSEPDVAQQECVFVATRSYPLTESKADGSTVINLHNNEQAEVNEHALFQKSFDIDFYSFPLLEMDHVVVMYNCESDELSARPAKLVNGQLKELPATEDYHFVWSNGATTQTIDRPQDMEEGDQITVEVAHRILGSLPEYNKELIRNGSYTWNGSLSATLDKQHVDCPGEKNGSITAVVTGGRPLVDGDGIPYYKYEWSSGGTDATESDLATGPYTVTITDKYDCTIEISGEVKEPEPLEMTEGKTVGCHNDLTFGKWITIEGGTPGTTPPYTFSYAGSAIQGTVITTTEEETETVEEDIEEMDVLKYVMVEKETKEVTSDKKVEWLERELVNCRTVEIPLDVMGAREETYTEQVLVTYYGEGMDSDGKPQTFTVTNEVEKVRYVPEPLDEPLKIEYETCDYHEEEKEKTVQVTEMVTVRESKEIEEEIKTTRTVNKTTYKVLLNGLKPGELEITITDANGCEKIEKIDIKAPEELKAEIQEQGCFDQTNHLLEAVVSGGQHDYTYLWNNDPDQTAQTLLSPLPGNNTLVSTDDNNCVITASYSVEKPDITIIGGEPNCTDGAEIQVSIDNAPEPHSGSWSNGTTGFEVTGVKQTEIDFTLTYGDQNCQMTITVPSGLDDDDKDGTPNCDDLCPDDPGKIEPGACGCGEPDLDPDGDGGYACNNTDECPLDPNKKEPGDCGCGKTDTDANNNGLADCLEVDQCPNDPHKDKPGICGCGTPDVDSDNDGKLDCEEDCPNDPDKTKPGTCGCGTSDDDTDGDGKSDCEEDCPNNADKVVAGVCGCGNPDVDTDGDGKLDCEEECPNDPDKILAGQCGCGTPDMDTDGDGTPDCNDECLNDPEKIEKGDCGCRNSETDTDSDGTPDCIDLCANDPKKTAPGDCGCNVPDITGTNCLDPCDADLDGNGIVDGKDGTIGYDAIYNQINPDSLYLDVNKDGVVNNHDHQAILAMAAHGAFCDLCPNNPNKTEPGICGCNVPDDPTDTDGDGTPDCVDECQDDPNKTAPGFCGCGVKEVDNNGDQIPDCFDPCLADFNNNGYVDNDDRITGYNAIYKGVNPNNLNLDFNNDGKIDNHDYALVVALQLNKVKCENGFAKKGTFDNEPEGVFGDEVLKGNNEEPTLYPNPIIQGERLHLEKYPSGSSAHLYDGIGNLVQIIKLKEQKDDIQTSHLNPGIYIVNIVQKDAVSSYRFRVAVMRK